MNRRDFLKVAGVVATAGALNACSPCGGKEGESVWIPTPTESATNTPESLGNRPEIVDVFPPIAFPGERIIIEGKDFLTAKTDVNKLAVVFESENGGASILLSNLGKPSVNTQEPAPEWEDKQVGFWLPGDFKGSKKGNLRVINGEGMVSNPMELEIIDPESEPKDPKLFIKTNESPDGTINVAIKSINIPVNPDTWIWTTISDKDGNIYYVNVTSSKYNQSGYEQISTQLRGSVSSIRSSGVLHFQKGQKYGVAIYKGGHNTKGDPKNLLEYPAVLQDSFEIFNTF